VIVKKVGTGMMFVFVYQLSTTCAFGFWRVGVWVFSLRFTEVEMFVCVCLFVINQPPAFGFGFGFWV
jgi:hypothetical protein